MTSALNGIINFKQGSRIYLDSTIRQQSLAFDLDSKTLLYSPSGTTYYEFFPGQSSASNISSSLENYVSVLYFGAVGDGISDDTQSFVSAINYASANNVTVKVPAGIYNLATWSTKDIFSLCLVGDGYNNTRIVGNTIPGIYFVNILSSGSIQCNGISFENFDNCIYSKENIYSIVVDSCKFLNMRNRSVYLNGYSTNIYVTGSSANPERKCDRVLFTNNYIEKSQGLVIQGGFDSAIATGNHFENIIRNLNIWSESNDRTMYGVCLGWGDNIPAEVCQNYSVRAIMCNNTINKMYNSSPSGSRTINGLIALARSVVVSNNCITNVSSAPGGDAEAIYCKAQDYICSNNVIYDGSPEGASITLKGGTYSAPLGRNNIVSNNIIRSVGAVCKWGIAVFNTGYLTIKDNIIDGTKDDAILLFKEQSNVDIIGNQIVNCGSTKIVNFSCSQIDNVRIEGNSILTPTRTSGSILSFRFTTQQGWVLPTSIQIVSGGSGYTTLPKIVWNGVTLSNPRLYLRDGALVGFYTDESPGSTFPPIITVSGGGGTGAVISATQQTDGHFRNVCIKNNSIFCSPKKPISEFNGYSFSISTNTSSSFENVEFIDNTITLSGSYADLSTYNKMIDVYFSSDIDGVMNNVIVDGLKVYTDLTDTQLSRLVTINAEPLSKHWRKYNNIKVSNVLFNNRTVDIPVKSNVDKNISTFSLNFDSTSGYIGNIKLGDIPGNNIVTESYVVNGSSPIKSLTSASTISLYGYSVVGGNQILSSTPISAFSSNSIIQGNQNGQVSNSKMFPATSNGNVPVYLVIGNEPITSGSIKFVVKTMQY